MVDFWYDRTRFESSEEALAFLRSQISYDGDLMNYERFSPAPPQPLQLRVIPGGKQS